MVSASGLSYWIDMRLTDELGASILIFRIDVSVFLTVTIININ